MPLYYLALPLAAGFVLLWPQPALLTDLSLWYLWPLWVLLSHLLVGVSYVVTSRKLKRGYWLTLSSVAVYGRQGSITHLQAALLIALAEEVGFRYGLLWLLVKLTGSGVISLVLTSILFAVAHVPTFLRRSGRIPSLLRLLDLLLLGLILGALTLGTCSLYPALIIHTLRNYILRCLLISKEEYAALHNR